MSRVYFNDVLTPGPPGFFTGPRSMIESVSNHILIAEDNPALIEVMREILETEGYRVTCAVNGHEALKAFEFEQPDLILSDVMMPQMDGFALLEAIRTH